MFQIEVWKSQESFTYFKIFKPISWGKRPAERRRRLIQRFPKERVPASLRIRLSEALAKAGRAFLLSESSRDPRPDPQATADGFPVPVIEIARKPETSGKTDRLRPYRQLFRAFGKAARAWRGAPSPIVRKNGGARGLSKYGFTNSARCGILELNDRLRHGAVSLPDERKGDAKCSRKFSPAFLR